jgi:Ion channel
MTDDPKEQPIELGSEIPGSRAGTPFRERFREPDSYGLLFVGLIAVFVVSAALSSFEWGRAVTFLLMGCTLLFALWTSRAPRRLTIAAEVLFPLVVVFAIVGIVNGERSPVVEVLSGLIVLLHVAVLIAILRRMATHLVISWQTVMAALCIYLLIGMTFAALFGFLDTIYSEGVFAGDPHVTIVDFLYFSFITMTTVGYGDLTPGPDSIRMLAVTEALVGQIFLVTALALLVGNLGRQRRGPAPPPPEETDR